MLSGLRHRARGGAHARRLFHCAIGQLLGAVGWGFGGIAGAGEQFNQGWFRRLVADDMGTRLSNRLDILATD